jgi:hypothetical protein
MFKTIIQNVIYKSYMYGIAEGYADRVPILTKAVISLYFKALPNKVFAESIFII